LCAMVGNDEAWPAMVVGSLANERRHVCAARSTFVHAKGNERSCEAVEHSRNGEPQPQDA
jgi:transcriptional regulator of met regulon